MDITKKASLPNGSCRLHLWQVMQEKAAQKLLAQTLHLQMLEELRNYPQVCFYVHALIPAQVPTPLVLHLPIPTALCCLAGLLCIFWGQSFPALHRGS